MKYNRIPIKSQKPNNMNHRDTQIFEFTKNNGIWNYGHRFFLILIYAF